MTLVGIYALTSPSWVSMIGRAVMDPPEFNLEERSSSLECK